MDLRPRRRRDADPWDAHRTLTCSVRGSVAIRFAEIRLAQAGGGPLMWSGRLRQPTGQITPGGAKDESPQEQGRRKNKEEPIKETPPGLAAGR